MDVHSDVALTESDSRSFDCRSISEDDLRAFRDWCESAELRYQTVSQGLMQLADYDDDRDPSFSLKVEIAWHNEHSLKMPHSSKMPPWRMEMALCALIEEANPEAEVRANKYWPNYVATRKYRGRLPSREPETFVTSHRAACVLNSRISSLVPDLWRLSFFIEEDFWAAHEETNRLSMELPFINFILPDGAREIGLSRCLKREHRNAVDWQKKRLATSVFDKPQWNRDCGELAFGGEVVKRIRSLDQATNIVKVLDAFQEEGWPQRIDDPVTDGTESEKLSETARSLNTNLRQIAFLVLNKGFSWQTADA